MPRRRGAGLAIVAERPLQLFEKVGLGAEMAEMLVAALGLLRHLRAHLGAVVAMERVAFDVDGVDVLTEEYLLKRLLD